MTDVSSNENNTFLGSNMAFFTVGTAYKAKNSHLNTTDLRKWKVDIEWSILMNT